MSLYAGITLPGRPAPANVQKLDLLPLHQIRRMQRVGVAVDREWLWDLSGRLEVRKGELRAEIIEHIPADQLERFVGEAGDDLSFNPDSYEQVGELLYRILQVGRGSRLKRTKSGKAISTGKKQLEALKWEHPAIAKILEYREVSKLKGTFCDALPLKARLHTAGDCGVCGFVHQADHWRIHATINTTRTVAGRLSCTASWTPVKTTRGTVSIKSIVVGDLVWTHRLRWRRITARWTHGPEQMYDVLLSTGDTLTCTGYHRVLEYTYEHLENLGTGTKEHRENADSLPLTRTTNHDRDRREVGDDVSQCPMGMSAQPSPCGVRSPDEGPVLQIQDGGQEPNVWKGGGSAPQLDWTGTRWTRVSDLYERRQAPVCTSGCDGRGTWVEGTSRGLESTSHRRRQAEQRPGEPRSGDQSWTSAIALPTGEGFGICYVEAINPVGCFEVFDLEVEEDESYETCGVFSHNCKSPNLQQIPVRTKMGREVRKGFIAGPGKLLVSCDLSQLHLRLVAHLAQEPAMIQVFQEGGDIHTETARRAFGLGPDETPDKLTQRDPSKTTNFFILNRGGWQGLFDVLVVNFALAGMSRPSWLTGMWCDQFIAKWFGMYSHIGDWFDVQDYRMKRYGIVWDMFGRVRRVPEMRSVHERVRDAGLRQGGNHPLIGGEAGIYKIAQARIEDRLCLLRAQGVGVEAVIPVHDELVLEADDEWADYVASTVCQEMEQALVDEQTGELQCRVPITAESKIGERWSKE